MAKRMTGSHEQDHLASIEINPVLARGATVQPYKVKPGPVKSQKKGKRMLKGKK